MENLNTGIRSLNESTLEEKKERREERKKVRKEEKLPLLLQKESCNIFNLRKYIEFHEYRNDFVLFVEYIRIMK